MGFGNFLKAVGRGIANQANNVKNDYNKHQENCYRLSDEKLKKELVNCRVMTRKMALINELQNRGYDPNAIIRDHYESKKRNNR